MSSSPKEVWEFVEGAITGLLCIVAWTPCPPHPQFTLLPSPISSTRPPSDPPPHSSSCTQPSLYGWYACMHRPRGFLPWAVGVWREDGEGKRNWESGGYWVEEVHRAPPIMPDSITRGKHDREAGETKGWKTQGRKLDVGPGEGRGKVRKDGGMWPIIMADVLSPYMAPLPMQITWWGVLLMMGL